MAKILLITKIYPKESETNLDNLANIIKNTLSVEMQLRKYDKIPLAFGLHYLKCEFVIDERDGILDELEKLINSIMDVSQLEITNQSRLSVNM